MLCQRSLAGRGARRHIQASFRPRHPILELLSRVFATPERLGRHVLP